MHLKRLEAFGFKSFADPVSFEFDRGITGIVGPNGCGKSNVVDAVKWALGEQRPTSIRGSEMSDVLFAGSGGRKPLGLAEVSLTFDNADRFLAMDTDEVVLTRRLYRDGTSEYLLNRESSRLKDIRDLLLDTGGGRGAMAILEQGRIDAVLQENPVERRVVFEEAAGIARYRLRQKETLRRVEHLDENLGRLRDVLSVTEKQLRSIRSQAGRAERWKALDEEWRRRRIELALHRYAALLGDRAAAAARVEELAAREAETNARLAALSGDLREGERRVHEARDRAAALEAEAGKSEGAAEAALERAASEDRLSGELEGRIRWYEGEIQTTVRRLEEAEAQAAEARASEDAAAGEVAERAEDLRAADTAIAAATAAHRERTDAVQALRTRALALLERKGRLANARARAEAEAEALRARAARLARRGEELEGERERAGERHARTALAAREAAEAAATARSALAAAEGELAAAEGRISDLRVRFTALDRAVSSARSRLDVLTSLRDRHEGLGRGARRILEEARKAGGGGLSGVRGVLADLIETDVADAEAVELALGPAAEGIVVETFEDARRAVTLLQEEGIGRALFLPLDSVRAAAPSPEGAVAGRAAAAAVRCADDLRPVVDGALAGTLLVADLDTARALSAETAGVRLVTGGGEVLDGRGGMAGGRGADSGHGLLARNAEIRTLRQRLAGEERRLSTLQGEVRATESLLEEARAAVVRCRAEAREAESTGQSTRAAADGCAADLRRADDEASVLGAERTEVGAELARREEAAGALAAEAAAAEEEGTALAAEQDAALAAESAASDARRAAEEGRAEARVGLARAVERRDASAHRRGAAERALHDGRRNLEVARVDMEACRGRREASIRSASTARSEAEEARARRERAVRDLVRAREAVVEATRVLEDLRLGVSAVDDEYRSYRGTLETFRLRESESRMRIEALLARMRDELRVDLEQLHAAPVVDGGPAVEGPVDGAPAVAAGPAPEPAPGPAPFDEEAAERAIDELRTKIERMGNVNLEALDQIGDVEKQARELREQEQDLSKAREDLMEALRLLNRQSRERFQETFARIREHFQETFRRLFGGGKADIFLEEGEDILESGVEVVARPPGKELRSISLLSGGERTLTAVALLFAVYRAKPSPFCILDEVDAALDESNVGRFTAMVRDFLDSSQFIIITHNKKTMTTAGRIYGISMAEPGVSTHVLLELEQVAGPEAVEAA